MRNAVHQLVVVGNGPDALSVFIVIDPQTGKPVSATTYKPISRSSPQPQSGLQQGSDDNVAP